MKRFTAIEVMICVAIFAIIASIVIPALNTEPRKSTSSRHQEYEGWTYVVDAPYGRAIYFKHIPDQRVTIWWNHSNSTFQVVKDEAR